MLVGFVPRGNGQPQRGKPGDDLGGTSWQLVKFVGDQTLTPAHEGRYTVTFGQDGRISVRIACNRGTGRWKSAAPDQLDLSPLALTRALCPPAPLNNKIAKDWHNIRSYTRKDGHLFLSLKSEGGTYEFEPQPPSASAVEEGSRGVTAADFSHVRWPYSMR